MAQKLVLKLVGKKNSLRIIGGTWRSRRIQFADVAEIRPTPDRIRETLFNWLAEKIVGARCLDLFAGSGALGFEAASRGASHVTQVDSSATIVAMLAKQKQLLAAQQLAIVHQDALDFLQQTEQQFDVVFLDPPFASDCLKQILPILIARKLVVPSGLLYIESSVFSFASQHLEALSRRHEKQTGQVHYALYELHN